MVRSLRHTFRCSLFDIPLADIISSKRERVPACLRCWRLWRAGSAACFLLYVRRGIIIIAAYLLKQNSLAGDQGVTTWTLVGLIVIGSLMVSSFLLLLRCLGCCTASHGRSSHARPVLDDALLSHSLLHSLLLPVVSVARTQAIVSFFGFAASFSNRQKLLRVYVWVVLAIVAATVRFSR